MRASPRGAADSLRRATPLVWSSLPALRTMALFLLLNAALTTLMRRETHQMCPTCLCKGTSGRKWKPKSLCSISWSDSLWHSLTPRRQIYLFHVSTVALLASRIELHLGEESVLRAEAADIW